MRNVDMVPGTSSWIGGKILRVFFSEAVVAAKAKGLWQGHY